MSFVSLPLSIVAVLAPATEWEPIGMVLLKLLTIFFLVLLNGFFVASEFAIVKVRGSQLDSLIERGTEGAKFARHVASHLDAYLSATQLGITLASLALGWLGEPFLARMVEPVFALAGVTSPAVIHASSFALAFAAITFLHIVLGELAPKSLAIRKSVETTLWVSRPLGVFYTVFKPAIWLLNGAANFILRHFMRVDPVAETELVHSEEELRLILGESHQAEEVSTLEKEMLLNVLDLRSLAVRDITTPRRNVLFLDLDESFAENLRLAKTSGHTRFPLCRRHLDETVGLIHIKDLLTLAGEPDPNLLAIKRELLVVPEMLPLPRLLDLFLSRHAHMALALDEFGGATGIVTLDNVLEELVGEIQDESDREPPKIERLSAEEFIVRGQLSLHELRAQTDLRMESEEVTTVGGYITERLGHLPKEGDTLRVDGYRATVTKCDSRRARRVKFQRSVSSSQSEHG